MPTKTIDNFLAENRLFPPPPEFSRFAEVKSLEHYREIYSASLRDSEKFWSEIASTFHWFTPWKRMLNWDNPPFARWFDGGTTNIAYNCLDRHLEGWRKNKIAILWQGEPEDDRRAISYLELHREVGKTANGLKKLGVGKGDRVAIYLPMIPELACAMLACARIGATHSIVFGGFSAPALADRINDCQAKVLITADGGFRRGNIVPLKNIADEALESCPSIQKVIVVARTKADIKFDSKRDLWWHEALQAESATCPAEPLDSEHPLYILYTSGSTGKPKGILHTTGGYMVGTGYTTKIVFDLKDSDTFWCTADIGWVTGHSYVIYGPLANGATTVMYEGAPNQPGPDRFWKIIAENRVNIFYTAPTAIRSFMRWGDEHPHHHDLTSLRLLGSVGEPINPEAWMWYRRVIGQERCPIVDTWWQTETGAIMITPLPGATSTRPGCATLPFFGIEPGVVDERGEELPPGKGGFLVIKRPWPSMLRTLYGDDQKFKEYYWSRFAKQGFYLAGDGAVRDEQGYITILGRIDDVINVSGHRLSTMELESALVAHPAVVEAAVIGYDHAIKGSGIAAFVTPAPRVSVNPALSLQLAEHVKKTIGAFAKPDQIRFTEALPKTRSGKIMRRLLRDIASGKETQSDTSTLEDFGTLARLREQEDS